MKNKITSVEYNIIKKSCLLYHQNLAVNPEKIKLIEEMFGILPDTIKTYQIGYCDGANQTLFPDNPEIITGLKNMTFLKETGEEYFKDTFTIPVYDSTGQIAEIASLPLNTSPIQKKHIKIMRENSFMNWQCLKMHKEIIFTYSLPLFFDAIQKGIRNVVPIFTNFISDNQVRVLTEEQVKKICFTFICNDKYLLKKLGKTNIQLFNMVIKDLKGIDSSNITRIFKEAWTVKPKRCFDNQDKPEKAKETNNQITDTSSENTETPIKKINSGYEFKFKEREYKILGVKNDFVAVLKVLVKVKQGEYTFFDSLDLYSQRSRSLFIKEMVQKINIGDEGKEIVEKEIMQIIESIEQEREKEINSSSRPVEYVMTEEEKAEGLKLLQSADIFSQIDSDMTRLGYVGEKINKIITYLVATSRKMASPLASIIVSRSAAGKSKLVETIEKLMPPEDVISMTASTDQAFYYMTDGMMKNKLVTISEQEGKNTADYPIRELLSRKYLSKAIPIKDRNGNTKTIFIKAEGPISYIETTTNFNVHPENSSRCFQMYIDESEEQTGNVQISQKQSKTKEFYLSKTHLAEIYRKHQSAQRMLKPVIIFNPYVEHIRFPKNKLRTRRDHDKFLNLIEVITFIFQEQRNKQKMKLEDGQEIEYIESTLEDYRITYELVSDGILQNTLDDLLKSTKDLLSFITKMVKETAEKEGTDPVTVHFTRKMVLDYTSWGFSQVRDHIKTLLDFELLEVVRGNGNGQRHQYKLTNGLESSNIYVSLISTPEEIEQKIIASHKHKSKTSPQNLTNQTEPVGLPVSL